MIFNTHYPYIGGSGGGVPQFEYTGTYEYIDDGGGNWRIKFLTSGTFTPLKAMTIDAFLVGGGGGGNIYAGGGGGYTKTAKSIELAPKSKYAIVVGSGGTGIKTSDEAKAGSKTSAFGETANGGIGAGHAREDYNGGAGGSGDGAAGYRRNGAKGGEDGGSGGSTTLGAGGAGQGTTTREFGESSGVLYSGGGGGSSYGEEYSGGAGGQGGGGDGGAYGSPGSNGETNTGGGGGAGSDNGYKYGGTGGSGIVIIRKAK